MSWGAVAIGVGTLAAGVIGSSMQADAASDAANAAAESGELSAYYQWKQYQQQRADQQPWLDAGTSAVNRIASGLESGGEFDTVPTFTAPDFSFTSEDLYSDPSYAFRKQEGLDAVNASNSASGLFGSGRGYNALMERGQDLASQEYSNAYNRAQTEYGNQYTADLAEYNSQLNSQNTLYNRLAGVSGTGQTTASQIGSTGMTAATNAGNALMSSTNASNAGNVGAANAYSTGLQSAGNSATSLLGTYLNYQQNQNLMNSLTGTTWSGGQTGVNYLQNGGWY